MALFLNHQIKLWRYHAEQYALEKSDHSIKYFRRRYSADNPDDFACFFLELSAITIFSIVYQTIKTSK
ncbi:hypothetical protein D7V32_13730 [Acinetobacter tianfuensis]|uniref:Uncharacterized protein n=1 Tax=Acinetobacter tianfuensis TaxID=2419603 RepID=A0A3A8E6C6_9GAMM|nr:hypothetical protein D7V32_13730 [Acinetobacter tianfuensis]